MNAQGNFQSHTGAAGRREERAGGPELTMVHGMAGKSAPMQRVYQFIDRVAPTDATVLIYGESGTGKELVARAIHNRSPRSAGPLVAVNCAALPEQLLESELFGHARGAFTGAVCEKKGRFEMADGGTLFLDEIGELPPALQAKLLRALQEREFERVGGTRTIRVNVRVIAATNVDLRAASDAGTFRRDLYFRLDVVSVRVPPLRERREDIPLLAALFTEAPGLQLSRRITAIAPDAIERMMSYSWPGNVRELQNAIHRAAVLGTSDMITVRDLPPAVAHADANESADQQGPRSYHGAVRDFKQQLILGAVRESGGNLTGAAGALHLHPNYLHRLIRALGLREAVLRHRASEDRVHHHHREVQLIRIWNRSALD